MTSSPIPVVLHAHFYQPPRDNPWTERVEREPSAAPFHDWNERIASECYAANAHARVFGAGGRIVDIVNNYEWLSFNIGPTLFAWLERHDPETYRRIIEADKRSAAVHAGHGNAIAQAYNHAILPLCNERDRRTQIRWGIADFVHRFGRVPEAMWLPETACNVATATALAEHGMRYVILAPRQAARVKLRGSSWKDVSDGSIDPRRPYRLSLPGGRSIVCFFYDGPAAHAFSFEAALDTSRSLADRLVAAASSSFGRGQLVNVATDGETYGHHKRFADRALAYFVWHEAMARGLELTNYAAFLDGVAVDDEVELAAGPDGQGTAWSCAHGLGRWSRDCGCNSAHRAGWSQAWRTPLRAAFDRLRDHAAKVFEEAVGDVLRDPWEARDAYIEVVLDPTSRARDAFLKRHALREVSGSARTRVWELLEAQRMFQLMYTSCGWFFDDLAGLETVQVMKYAVMGAQLVERATGRLSLPLLLEGLAQARSNVPEQGSGADIVRNHVLAQEVTPGLRLARRASRLLFDELPSVEHDMAFTVHALDTRIFERGSHRLVVGRARVVRTRTEESVEMTYAATAIADREMHCGVSVSDGRVVYDRLVEEAAACFKRPSLIDLVRLLDRTFGSSCYTLRDLAESERSEFIEHMINGLLERLGASFSFLYDENRKTMEAIEATGVEVPRELRLIAEYTLARRFDAAVLEALEGSDNGSVRAALAVAREARSLGIDLRVPRSERMIAKLLADAARSLSAPSDEAASRMLDLLDLAAAPGLHVALDRPQEIVFVLLREGKLDQLDATLRERLAERLMIEPPSPAEP
jgi:hypothetical protein